MPESKQVDHRQEAREFLEAATLDAAENPARSTSNIGIDIALVHSQLAVADELKGIREELGKDRIDLAAMFRELMARTPNA